MICTRRPQTTVGSPTGIGELLEFRPLANQADSERSPNRVAPSRRVSRLCAGSRFN